MRALAPSPKSELEQLRSEIQRLRALARQRRQVDLVDWGLLRVFMYVDDLAYQGVQPPHRHGDPLRPREQVSLKPQTAEQAYTNVDATLFEALLGHHWTRNIDFAFLDIGCQYGSTAILLSKFIQSCGRSNQIFAFEPGMAGDLVPFSLELNNVESTVHFEPLAVTARSGPILLFGECGHSENNRTVNRNPATEYFSSVVRATSVDDYVDSHAPGKDLIVKVDTQGAEPEVLRGMKRSLESRHVTLLFEFTPSALKSRIADPAGWLGELRSTHHLVDTGGIDVITGVYAKTLRLVQKQSLREFTDRVDRSRTGDTDVLAIPHHLPDAEGLLNRLGVRR